MFISSAFTIETDHYYKPSDCLTDEFYGNLSESKYVSLIARRNMVRELMKKKLHRKVIDTLYVPIVFHNLYKVVGSDPIGSYCDFGYSDENHIMVNDQNICKQRILRSLEVLNAQYAPIAVQFYLPITYPEILNANA